MKYEIEERLIWFKGELIPIKDAKVMVFSPTAQFGLNVFEGIPCYWNDEDKKLYAFRLYDHYERLLKSASLLQIDCPYTIDEMKKSLESVIQANEICENINVRQTLFVDDFGSWAKGGKTEMFIVATPKKFGNAEYNTEGLRVCISSWRRINDNSISPRIKCGANYLNSRMGQREAIRNGYDTCVFLNEYGYVSEGPGSCFFMVKNNKLITPSLSDSVLESITRDTVINLAKTIGVDVEERSIARTEVYTAEEAFLCGSAMEIKPILQIDGFYIKEKVDGITSVIKKMYNDIVYNKNKDFSKWVVLL